jgi:hypothetical protein
MFSLIILGVTGYFVYKFSKKFIAEPVGERLRQQQEAQLRHVANVFATANATAGADPADAARKKCPDCAEFVQVDARVCRFCRHQFAE